jgi:hypothetical protein
MQESTRRRVEGKETLVKDITLLVGFLLSVQTWKHLFMYLFKYFIDASDH